jgi:hypothetical protein
MRQSVGLMAAHTAFTALIGAGFGVARQLHDPNLRRFVIERGFLAAIGCHFANDALFSWADRTARSWFHATPWLDTVIVPSLVLIVLQGPLVGLYLLLLRQGLRSQAAGLTTELTAEARTGSGAVQDAEVPILLKPARRFWLRLVFLRRYGFAASRTLRRLQAAQLDLGTQRWHRARGEAAPDAPPEDLTRQRILRLRYEIRAHLQATHPTPASA